MTDSDRDPVETAPTGLPGGSDRCLDQPSDVKRSYEPPGRPLLKGLGRGIAFTVACGLVLVLFAHEWRTVRAVGLGAAVVGTAVQYRQGARSVAGWLLGLAVGSGAVAVVLMTSYVVLFVTTYQF
jgi:hypothetical protein